MESIIDNIRKCRSILESVNSIEAEAASECAPSSPLDVALELLKEIDSEVINATLSLVENRELTMEQFYLLRSLKVLTMSANIEYSHYLTERKSGTFAVDHATQIEAAAAWVELPRNAGNTKCEQDADVRSATAVKSKFQ